MSERKFDSFGKVANELERLAWQGIKACVALGLAILILTIWWDNYSTPKSSAASDRPVPAVVEIATHRGGEWKPIGTFSEMTSGFQEHYFFNGRDCGMVYKRDRTWVVIANGTVPAGGYYEARNQAETNLINACTR